VFARFYFLSNEDLLDILANSSKNPDAVQVCKNLNPLKTRLFTVFVANVNSLSVAIFCLVDSTLSLTGGVRLSFVAPGQGNSLYQSL